MHSAGTCSDIASRDAAVLLQAEERAAAMREEIRQLHCALATRDTIGQAKGILMERYGVNAAKAFRMLVKLSQNSNTPVSIVAQQLVEVLTKGNPEGHSEQASAPPTR